MISLAESKPELLKEWDFKKNDIDPSKISCGTGKKAWWVCPKGHSYYSSIANRINRNSGCPYCANQKVLVGYNDLATTNPELLKEWDFEKNIVKPTDVHHGSAMKVWWICPKGHSYEAKLNNRSSANGTTCPYCSNYKVLPGLNDLATTNPELIDYWDYEKNGNLKPNMVMKGQHKQVWWIGECGHSWKSTIYHMVEGKRCPICNIENKSSFPEQVIYFYLKRIFDDIEIGNRTVLNGKELDIYIPSLKTAIEFDGDAWHKNIEKDIVKNKLCEEHNIHLFRIRDRKCSTLPVSKNVYIIKNDDYSDKSISASVNHLFIMLGLDIKTNLEKDRTLIYSQYMFSKKSKSLKSLANEKIVDEWDYVKNKELLPDMISYKSNKKVWWICSKGHSWQAPVSSRTNQKANCPYCSGRLPIKGINDLTTTHPELAKEWDYVKNKNITPEMVSKGSGKKVWWICPNGHSYNAIICNRTAHHSGCPKCRLKK